MVLGGKKLISRLINILLWLIVENSMDDEDDEKAPEEINQTDQYTGIGIRVCAFLVCVSETRLY